MSQSNQPNEIMKNVFGQIALLDPQEARQALYQSLFVSKNWSGFAKIESYENVHLPQDKIAVFALNVSESGLGYLVKNMEFYPVLSAHPQNYYTIPPGVEDALDTILQKVPNLESISSLWIDFTGYILRRLQASEQQFECLKSLPFSEKMNLDERDLYASLALKFKGSLTKLSLIYDGPSNDFILLKTNLKDFNSLEHLRLCSSFASNSIIVEVNELVDNCHKTAQILSLQECDLSGNHSQTGPLNPNNSIKTLQFSDSILSVSTIQYFSNKLAALETLVITTASQISPRPQTEEEISDWWNQMKDLCQRSRNYNISIGGFNSNYLHQIEHWANISNTIAGSNSHQEGSAIEIDLNQLTDDEKALENSHIVRFKQHGSRVHLFESNSHASFTKIANIDQILKCINPFLPNVIRISNVDQLLCGRLSLNEAAHPDFFKRNVRSKNWAVFDGVVALISDKPKSVVHLDRMILPELKYTGEIISELVSALMYTSENISKLVKSNIPELMYTGENISELVKSNICELVKRNISELVKSNISKLMHTGDDISALIKSNIHKLMYTGENISELVKSNISELVKSNISELIYTGENIHGLVKSNISELKFTNSLLHYSAFPQIASKLSEIGTLVLDGCLVTPGTTQGLNISLPRTRLGHLQLNLDRKLYPGSLGRYKIVVTRSTKKTTYQYIEDKDCKTYQEVSDAVRSEDYFPIHILCAELKSWAVTDIKLDNSKTECKQMVLEESKQ